MRPVRGPQPCSHDFGDSLTKSAAKKFASDIRVGNRIGLPGIGQWRRILAVGKDGMLTVEGFESKVSPLAGKIG